MHSLWMWFRSLCICLVCTITESEENKKKLEDWKHAFFASEFSTKILLYFFEDYVQSIKNSPVNQVIIKFNGLWVVKRRGWWESQMYKLWYKFHTWNINISLTRHVVTYVIYIWKSFAVKGQSAKETLNLTTPSLLGHTTWHRSQKLWLQQTTWEITLPKQKTPSGKIALKRERIQGPLSIALKGPWIWAPPQWEGEGDNGTWCCRAWEGLWEVVQQRKGIWPGPWTWQREGQGSWKVSCIVLLVLYFGKFER